MTRSTSEPALQTAPLSPERVDALRNELKDLSRLNGAMFHQIFSGAPIESAYFASKFDRTNPQMDNCEATRGWDIRIEGDFYLLKRIGNHIYVIVGDAVGHHAYAGGLKVFVAAALQRIFDRLHNSRRPPSAARILKELDQFFLQVGLSAIEEDPDQPLRHGVDVVVVRIGMGSDGTVTYATAGLPVLALSREGTTQYGSFQDSKGISFPTSQEAAAPIEPTLGTIRRDGIIFLVFVTDGFRGLKRQSGNLERPRGELAMLEDFGDEGINAALTKAVTSMRAHPQSQPAAQIAEALVTAAQKFREGHNIPEEFDDDRLIVVIDLEAIRRKEGATGAEGG